MSLSIQSNSASIYIGGDGILRFEGSLIFTENVSWISDSDVVIGTFGYVDNTGQFNLLHSFTTKDIDNWRPMGRAVIDGLHVWGSIVHIGYGLGPPEALDFQSGLQFRLSLTPGLFKGVDGTTYNSTIEESYSTPVYKIFGGPIMNEGGTNLLTIYALGYPSGTKIDYVISGIDASRLESKSLQGSVTLDSLGYGTFQFGVLNNEHTDGPTTVKVSLANGATNYSILVNDTSLTPIVNKGTPSTQYFPLTGDSIVDATTHGYKWALGENRTIDFAVANGFNGEYWNNISLVSDYLKLAVEQFSNFADIKFNFSGSYANPTAAYNAGSEITLSVDGVNRFFNSPYTYAKGFFPDSSYNSLYQGAPGDVYLNQQSAANNLPSYLPGSEGWFVLIHELGHTLGLKHPHDDGGTGRPTYSSLGLGRLDIDLATIMSYNDDASLNQIGWDPATPMLLDVYALQYIYGKNTTINAGDTTFTLLADGFYKTLWDPSGTDTLDASTNSAGWTIHLPNVSLSTLVDTKAGYAAPTADYYASVPHSLTWLMGDFENVTGTSYDDTIDGNSFNNCIICNAGNDTVEAGDGFDTVYGGAGDDYIQGGKNGDKIYGGDGNDDLRAGNGLDSVDGGAGNDTIRGAKGTDTLTGGSGADDFVFATELDGVINIDTITDFTSGVDRIELSVSVFTALAGQIGRNVGLSQNIIYNASNGNLSYDADGSGVGTSVAFAVLGTTSHPTSVGTDFWVVA